MQRIIRPCCCSSGCRASSVYYSHPGREDRIQSLSSYAYCFIELSSIIMTKPACITVYEKYTHTASLVTATSRYYYSRNVTHAAYAKTDPASANTLHNAITCTIANTTINRVCLLGRVRGYFPAATSTGNWQGGVPFISTRKVKNKILVPRFYTLKAKNKKYFFAEKYTTFDLRLFTGSLTRYNASSG